jgi:hypothetical protein
MWPKPRATTTPPSASDVAAGPGVEARGLTGPGVLVCGVVVFATRAGPRRLQVWEPDRDGWSMMGGLIRANRRNRPLPHHRTSALYLQTASWNRTCHAVWSGLPPLRVMRFLSPRPHRSGLTAGRLRQPPSTTIRPVTQQEQIAHFVHSRAHSDVGQSYEFTMPVRPTATVEQLA